MIRSWRRAGSPRVWMLVFLPVTAGLAALAPERQVPLFVCACLAMVPLAAWIGRATEQLAERVGEGVGGLLNATLGNAAELIRGLVGIVKATLIGSIVGNLLLVLGAAVLAGGLRRDVQRFNATAARAQGTMLTLAAIALLAPAVFGAFGGRAPAMAGLSLAIAAVLIVTYACGLLFSLRTHRRLFLGAGCRASESEGEPPGFVPWSTAKAAAVLATAVALAAWVSEVLVGVVEPAARTLGMSDLFVGVVILAIVGNAAEHASAVQVARHDRMDLALGIAVGSSVQVALLVAPLLVLASRFVGPRPMDLVFTVPEALAMAAAVAIGGQVAADGESNWLEGVQLL